MHSAVTISAETVWSVTPVPDLIDRAPVSFCRNWYTDENNVIHVHV